TRYYSLGRAAISNRSKSQFATRSHVLIRHSRYLMCVPWTNASLKHGRRIACSHSCSRFLPGSHCCSLLWDYTACFPTARCAVCVKWLYESPSAPGPRTFARSYSITASDCLVLELRLV